MAAYPTQGREPWGAELKAYIDDADALSVLTVNDITPDVNGNVDVTAPGGAVTSVNGDGGAVVLNQDDILDGTTAKQFTATEKTKLAGVATSATANATDAALRDRSTHTGTQTQSTIVGLTTALGAKADLVGGVVPSAQLPSYVDDVVPFANLAAFPATGESGKIYIAEDTNLTYRWGGSSYGVLDLSLALGETSSTAYRGDRGKVAYDHSQITSGNPHGTTASAVPFTPVGTLAATNVQAAIAEVASESVQADGLTILSVKATKPGSVPAGTITLVTS